MFDTIVDQGNVRGVGYAFSIEFGPVNASRNMFGIFDPDFVPGRVIAEQYRIASPAPGDAGVDTQVRSGHAETENPFYSCAINPTCRSRVPRPSTTPDVRSLRVNVSRNHVRLNLVALHAGSGNCPVDRIEHAEQLAGLVAITECREGEHRPRGCMCVLSAIFANARNVAFDVAGIKRRFIEGRRKKQNQSFRPSHQLLVNGAHGSRDPAEVCRAAHHSPGLRDGINSALTIGSGTEGCAVVKIGAAVPISVPAVALQRSL